ncbi:MAG: hypothetical protein Q9174_005138, partial [Haloplaca sp. 1 TL-2023]
MSSLSPTAKNTIMSVFAMDQTGLLHKLVVPFHPGLHLGIIIAITVIVALVFATQPKRQYLAAGIPIVGLAGKGNINQARERFRHDSKRMLLEGYEKYKGNPFYVPTKRGERLMIPPKYVEELKNAPASIADFPATFVEVINPRHPVVIFSDLDQMFEGQITTIGTEQSLHPRIIKNQLNHHLPAVLPEVDDEVTTALELLLPDCNGTLAISLRRLDLLTLCPDWTEVNIGDIMTRTVARASSRMFGGTTLSNHEDWTRTMIDFTNDSFLAAQRLKDFPYYTRPLCQYFIPAVKRVFHHFGLSEELIVPIINSRENVKGKPKDLLQWLSENAGDRSKETISQISLHVAFAAIHTSAIGVTHILFDLCAMPEYIDPIREEVAAALESTDGLPSKKSFLKMPKLDSFMRESQRFNPLLLSQSHVLFHARITHSLFVVTFERLIRHDLTLTDGFTIPANTQIGVPAHA